MNQKMSYKEIKDKEMTLAEEVVEKLNNSPDKYIVYRTSRPITDIKQMFQTSCEKYGDNVAFRQRFVKGEPFSEITYKEALHDVNALGTALTDLGLKDKRIGIIGDNCYQWAISYLAVISGVGVVVPLDKELSSSDLKQLAIEAELSLVMCTKKHQQDFLDMVKSGDTEIQKVVALDGDKEDEDLIHLAEIIKKGEALITKGDRRFLDAEIYQDEMAVLLFTSGTTGISKGVMLSNRNLCEDLMSAPTILNVNTWDIFFSVLPVHHTYECTCGFLMPLYKGASIAYCEGLKHIPKNLQEIRPTMLLAVPLIFESLYKNIMKNIRKSGKEGLVKKVMKINRFTKKVGFDLNRKVLKDIYKVFGGRMRVLISGGAAIDPQILEFFNELGFIAVQGYGLTECAPMAALNPDSHKYMRNTSVGKLLPGMEVKIEDKDEEGIGEICLKGNNVMMGYYNMKEETDRVIKDGWFYSGDLGYVDDENFIYITGRKKNVIITKNGKNVFPEELEYLLSKSDFVEESMVWAASDDAGQDITIVTTIKPSMEDIKENLNKENPTDEEIIGLLEKVVDSINENLPLYKKIRKINVRHEDFEKTTGKKIKRFVESNKTNR